MGGTYEVLFNGVEVERFAGAEPWPTDRPTVLFLGRHEERKGLGVLLEAFAAVPDPVDAVGGRGRAGHRGAAAAPPRSERVVWLGLLDDDEVAPPVGRGPRAVRPVAAAASRSAWCCSRRMAAGCAVVATDLPGYRAAAAGHAALVPPGDPAALGSALAGGGGRRRGGTGPRSPGGSAAGRVHAESWSMDRLARRYVDLYHRAGRRPAARPPGGDGDGNLGRS